MTFNLQYFLIFIIVFYLIVFSYFINDIAIIMFIVYFMILVELLRLYYNLNLKKNSNTSINPISSSPSSSLSTTASSILSKIGTISGIHNKDKKEIDTSLNVDKINELILDNINEINNINLDLLLSAFNKLIISDLYNQIKSGKKYSFKDNTNGFYYYTYIFKNDERIKTLLDENTNKILFNNWDIIVNERFIHNITKNIENVNTILVKPSYDYIGIQFNIENSELIDKLEKSNDDIDNLDKLESTTIDSLKCDICQNYKKNIVFNCGHSYCSKCVNEFKENICPYCRNNITKKIKIYL